MISPAGRHIVPWDGAPPRRGERLPLADPRSPSRWIDLEFGRSFSESMIRPWAERWFRARVAGAERIPDARAALLVMNHSGMGWPWDAILLMHKLIARSGYRREDVVRGFALPWFFRVPGLAPLILRTGMWPATGVHLNRLAAEGELVLYFPEGAPGMAKGWRRRYRIQPFHTSFLRIAARYRAPIVPCVCVGAEELHPFATNLESVARVANLPLFPFSPLQMLVFPTWLTSAMFVLPMRVKYFIGDPVMVRLDPGTATQADWRAAAEELRHRMQAQLDAAREAEVPPDGGDGDDDKAPIDTAPLWRYPWSPIDRALAALPWGWPVLYLRFWNAWQAAHPSEPSPDRPHWQPHHLDALDELALVLPAAWPATLLRHRRALFEGDPHGIARLLDRHDS